MKTVLKMFILYFLYVFLNVKVRILTLAERTTNSTIKASTLYQGVEENRASRIN